MPSYSNKISAAGTYSNNGYGYCWENAKERCTDLNLPENMRDNLIEFVESLNLEYWATDMRLGNDSQCPVF